MRTLASAAALLLLVSTAACEPPKDAAAPPAATATAAPGTAAPAAAEPPAAAHAGTTVELDGTAGKGSGYLVLPADKAGKHAAILVIQEWWGLNDWIKQNADRFASQGYVVLAVDLYRGKATSDPGVAHELMRGLPEDRAMADLEAGFAFLAARPDVDPARIGAVGWCMGGGYALALAANEPRLKASAVNYGKLITSPATLAKINASILGDFAGDDQGIPPADVKEFEKSMRAAGKDVDIKIYEGKGHAFMNPNNTKGYDEGAARDAWSRIDAFFAAKLKKG